VSLVVFQVCLAAHGPKLRVPEDEVQYLLRKFLAAVAVQAA